METPLRRVLRNRPFVWFLGSWVTASTGYSVFAISIVWLAYESSRSWYVVGAVLAVERAAYCLTFLVAPIADRVRNQRTIFLASYPLQALAAGVLGYTAATGTLSVPLLIGLVVLLSLLWDLSWAAANAAPGILVAADDQFAANGLAGLLGGVNTIAGFATGGVLILVVGAGGGMLLYAALLLAGTALALPLRIAPPAAPRESFSESFRSGWRAVLRGPGKPLLQLGAVDAVQGFFSAAPVLLLALVAVRTLGGSATGYAELFVAYVIGGVVAGLVYAHWNPRRRVGALLLGSLFASAATLALVAREPGALLLALPLWFAVGFAQSTFLDGKYTYLRGAVPAGELARVVSNLYLFPGVASTVGVLALGLLSAGVTVPTFAVVIAVGFLGAGALGLALPRVRALRF